MDLASFNAGLAVVAFLAAFVPLIYIITQGRIKRLQHIAFLVLTLAVLFQSLFNVLATMAKIHYPEHGSKDLIDLFNWIYYLFHVIYPAAYAYYVVVSMGFISKSDLRKASMFWIPCAGILLFFLLNPITQAVYTTKIVDGKYIMEVWSGSYVYWGMMIIYIVVSLIGFFKNVSTLTRRKAIGLLVFNVITIIGVTVELINPEIRVQLIAESLSLICVLIWFEADGSLVESKNGFYNRTAFINDNTLAMHNNQRYKIVAITLANRDYIRRAYNEELCRSICDKASKILKKLIGRNSLYYCGEGKLAFFYYEKDPLREREYIETLRNNMAEKLPLLSEDGAKTSWAISVADIPTDIASIAGLEDLFEGNPESEGVYIRRDGALAFIKRRSDVVAAFKRALCDGNFEVYFQPVWDTKTNSIRSAEALLRLDDPLLGRVEPSEFIPIAEASGDIKALGEFVFRETVRFWREENLKAHGLETVAINVSVKQLERDDLANYFLSIVRKEGVAASDITLEITESENGEGNPRLFTQLELLREAGFNLSLDDFGIGYANLNRLANTEFASVKMDRSLLANATSEKGQYLLEKNIALLRSFDMNVVQEGVETLEQLHQVLSYGVDMIQGFYFSRPLPEEEFLKYLESYKPIDLKTGK